MPRLRRPTAVTPSHTQLGRRGKGRQKSLTPADVAWIRDAVAFRKTLTNAALAKRFGISCSTLVNYSKGLHERYAASVAAKRIK